MTWWVLNYLTNSRSWNSLYTLASTTVQDHLIMAWSHHKPARHGIYRVVRGLEVLCGYRYVWDHPVLNHQAEEGDTYWHTFHIALLRSDQHLWYYLFAPDGPYDLEIQGPLIHIPPPEVHLWTTKVYVGTKLKGVFYSDTFTSPAGADPVWQTRNGGLFSLKIYQLEPDPLGAQFRLYCIAGNSGDRQVYRSHPPVGQEWVPILTNAEACTLTGAASGQLAWVAANTYFPGYLYVLFNTGTFADGIWCLRSINYGETWSAFQIYPGNYAYRAGNIMPGLVQGTSPYDPGTTLYAALCSGIGGGAHLWLSTDHGETWSLRYDLAAGIQTPRCLVDPTDQSTVYMGAFLNVDNPHELYRSEEHGANLVEVDDALHLGIMLFPQRAVMWINPTDRATATILVNDHLYTTENYSVTWTDHELIAEPAAKLSILWEQPAHLYLGKHTSGTFPPLGPANHVIFVSQTWGLVMEGKAGAHAWTDDGMGDSIPYNCGGVCHQGIQLLPLD